MTFLTIHRATTITTKCKEREIISKNMSLNFLQTLKLADCLLQWPQLSLFSFRHTQKIVCYIFSVKVKNPLICYLLKTMLKNHVAKTLNLSLKYYSIIKSCENIVWKRMRLKQSRNWLICYGTKIFAFRKIKP